MSVISSPIGELREKAMELTIDLANSRNIMDIALHIKACLKKDKKNAEFRFCFLWCIC